MKDELRKALARALQAEPRVLAAWEAGSAAFERDDADSDLDVTVVVEDDAVPAAVAIIERTAAATRPIATRWEVPQPSWHGHWQTFYQFENAPPLMLLDIAVMKRTSGMWLCEPEVHGKKPRVLFDRESLLATKHLDRAAHAAGLRRNVERLTATTALFHRFVEKELRRSRPVDAMHFYNSLVLGRLVEALRTLHCPQRASFAFRYVKDDLPLEAARRLESLMYVASPAALPAKKAEAVAWLEATLATLAKMDLARHLDEKLA